MIHFFIFPGTFNPKTNQNFQCFVALEKAESFQSGMREQKEQGLVFVRFLLQFNLTLIILICDTFMALFLPGRLWTVKLIKIKCLLNPKLTLKHYFLLPKALKLHFFKAKKVHMTLCWTQSPQKSRIIWMAPNKH